MKFNWKPRRVLAVVGGLLGADLLLSTIWLAAGEWASDGSATGQAIAVLWGDRNQLGPEGQRRIAHALALWRDGDQLRPIFCVGGARPASAFNGAELLCEHLAAAGVPRAHLRFGRRSNDTISNLDEVMALAGDLGLARVDLVSDPGQALRARLFIAPRAGSPQLKWRPYDYFSISPRPGLLTLWLRAHHEWIGAASLLLPAGIRTAILARIRS